MPKLEFEVLFFGSDPREDNGDCYGGEYFNTLVEALNYMHGSEIQHHECSDESPYLMLTGSGLTEQIIIKNPEWNESRREAAQNEWARETNRQYLMEVGHHAGDYDCEPYDPAIHDCDI